MKSRRTNRAKLVDGSCRNNGNCPHCRSNRTHSSRRRAPDFSWYGGQVDREVVALIARMKRR